MTDDQFRELCNTYGFAPSRALRELLDCVRAQERERIIAQNAPEIEKVNAHIKALEEAVAAEREACVRLAEETKAPFTADVIRARSNT